MCFCALAVDEKELTPDADGCHLPWCQLWSILNQLISRGGAKNTRSELSDVRDVLAWIIHAVAYAFVSSIIG